MLVLAAYDRQDNGFELLSCYTQLKYKTDPWKEVVSVVDGGDAFPVEGAQQVELGRVERRLRREDAEEAPVLGFVRERRGGAGIRQL